MAPKVCCLGNSWNTFHFPNQKQRLLGESGAFGPRFGRVVVLDPSEIAPKLGFSGIFWNFFRNNVTYYM